MVKIQCSKYQKLFKTLIRNIFQDMYCRAHKTDTLTSIQNTVPPRNGLNYEQHQATIKHCSTSLKWQQFCKMVSSVNYLFLVIFLASRVEIWVSAQDSPSNQAYLFSADAETFLYQDLKTTFSCQGTV